MNRTSLQDTLISLFTTGSMILYEDEILDRWLRVEALLKRESVVMQNGTSKSLILSISNLNRDLGSWWNGIQLHGNIERWIGVNHIFWRATL